MPSQPIISMSKLPDEVELRTGHGSVPPLDSPDSGVPSQPTKPVNSLRGGALMTVNGLMPFSRAATIVKILKVDPACKHIPIVAMTAFAMKGDEEKALEAGCDGYITKPIDTRKLSGQIESFLRRQPEQE